MKVVKNILSLFLVLTILNTFVGKTIHEVFFHHHHDDVHCEAKTSQHFHEQKAPSTDLICSFSFSASITAQAYSFGKVILNGLTNKNASRLQFFVSNLYLQLKTLRGPPFTVFY